MAGGYRSELVRWVGGVSAPSAQAGYRDLLAFWIGGISGGSGTPPVTTIPVGGHGSEDVDDDGYNRRLREHGKRQAKVTNDVDLVVPVSESTLIYAHPNDFILNSMSLNEIHLTKPKKKKLVVDEDEEMIMMLIETGEI